jgi:hypothetical protein
MNWTQNQIALNQILKLAKCMLEKISRNTLRLSSKIEEGARHLI